jgi:hypothetical protein
VKITSTEFDYGKEYKIEIVPYEKSAHRCGEVVRLTHWPLFAPRKISGTHFF